MLTNKKWRGVFTVPAAVRRPGVVGRLGLLLAVVVLVGCSPPGRQRLLQGERLIREGRPADAIEPLQKAVALLATNAPACAQAWNYLGLAFHYAQRPSEAAQAYHNALSKDFNLVVVRFNRGCLFLDHGNLSGALNELTTYTTHFPKDALGWSKLGTAQLRSRLLEPAERSFQRVLELNPGPSETATALNNLGLCLALRRRPHDAFKYFNAALKQHPNYPPALLNQGIVAQQQLNDRSLALDRYRAYLDAAGPSPNFDAVSNLAGVIETEFRPRAAVTNLPLSLVLITNLPPKPTNGLLVARTPEPPPVAATHVPAALVEPTSAPPATNIVRAPITPAVGPTPTPTPTPAPAPVTPPVTPSVASAVEPPSVSPPTNQVEPPLTAQVPSPPTPAPTPEPIPEPTPEPPPPPMEVVQLAPEPEVKTADEIAAPARTAPLAVQDTSASAGAAMATAPPRPPKPTVEAEADEPKPKKKSIVQRLNPLGWFGGKDKEEAPRKAETAPTPLPPPRGTASAPARAATTVQPSLAAVPATAPTPPPTPPPTALPTPPPAPVFARYSYLRPGIPVSGDRARAQAVLAEGVQAHKSGLSAQALAAYKQAVQADPSYFEAQYNLGVAAFDAAAWSEALAAFEHALALKPEDPNARLNFALALDRANYPVDAAAELNRLLAAAPENVDGHATLANLYAQKLADTPKARVHYAKVLQLDPRHPQAAAIRRWLAAHQGRP